MGEIRANIGELPAGQGRRPKGLFQRLLLGVEAVTRAVPYFGEGHYEHPPVNYGARKAAYLPQSPRGQARLGSSAGK